MTKISIFSILVLTLLGITNPAEAQRACFNCDYFNDYSSEESHGEALVALLSAEDMERSKVEDGEKIIKLVLELKTQLEDFNASASDTFDNLNSEIGSSVKKTTLQKLGKAVRNYDFEGALVIVNDISKDLNIKTKKDK